MAIKVDLLPTERKKFGFDPVIAILIVLIAASVVVFYYVGVKFDSDIETRKDQISRVDTEIQDIKKKLPRIKELKKENEDLETQINTVKSLRYDPIRYSNLLDEISSLIPANMWLNSINIEPGQQKVIMSGTAAALPGIRPLESIAGFMKNAQSSKYFRSCSLASTSRGTVRVKDREYTSYSFSFDLSYDPKAAESMSGVILPEASGKDRGNPPSRGHTGCMDQSIKGRGI